jgi:hypothetical protein
LPAADTPGHAERFSPRPDGYPHARNLAEAGAVAWRTVTTALAGTPHVRISRDGGRNYPAKHARPLPADPPGQPSTIPVYDPGTASGRMLALDLDAARGDVGRQAAGLGQLLGRIGARYLADASPGGRHVYVLFAAALPWLELRDLCRAIAVRFPAVDPAPMSSLGGQISPPGSRHRRGGWMTLTTPLEDARAAVERPNGPDVWAVLLTEFAAELQQVETGSAVAPVSAEVDDTGVAWIPRPAAAPPSALSSTMWPAPGSGTGPAAGTAAAPAWPSCAQAWPAAGG